MIEADNQGRGISDQELETALLEILRPYGNCKRVLIIPPDQTRLHSRAGKITEIAWRFFGDAVKAIIPALGTHYPMTEDEIRRMFGTVPSSLFIPHDWRNDVVELGRFPSSFLEELSGGRLSMAWSIQVNRILVEEPWDLIISPGQVVPHEVVGMANYTKNIIVGVGGSESIHKSHFLGAVCNMETIMGRVDNPVRRAMDSAYSRFLGNLPVLFIQTVVASDSAGQPRLRGLFAGEERSCFEDAAALSARLNITELKEAPKRVVVRLDPEEFKSTWLGNKSIYRTRMAIADRGELVVLAPGVRSFGEDREIDRLIRRYGYRNSETILGLVESEADLAENLAAAAHLIHGSPEGRFDVVYCPGKEPGGLTRGDIESVGYRYGDLDEMNERYASGREAEHEDTLFISNPALGLWQTNPGERSTGISNGRCSNSTE